MDRAKKNVCTLFPPKNREKIQILINVDYLLNPSVIMFIEGLSLEAHHAAQAERWSANTATAPASAAAAAAAERASSVSPPFFALSPPAEMDSIVSPRTPASADGPTPAITHLFSMLRILSKGGGGGVVARWWGDDDVGCWRWCAAVGGGGRMQQSTLGGRWEGGT